MSENTKQCPACKEKIDASALRCKFCTHEMSRNPATGQTAGESAAGWVSAIGFGILAVMAYQAYKSFSG
jgi:predicted amidophosphoribosyltransferase